jgi:hypothetical protein
MEPSSRAETLSTPVEEAPTKWRRFRLPTSIVTTVLGIALTAWLIPAITRQWDDRRKAHDLKASLLTDMASATAQALETGRSALFVTAKANPNVTRIGPEPAAIRSWTLRSIEIDAKLRAYFPEAVSADWRAYSGAMGFMLANVTRRYAGGYLPRPPATPALSSGLIGLRYAIGWVYLAQSEYYSRRHSVSGRFAAEINLAAKYRITERELLKVESQVASEVLAAHPSGFSTSAHDLLRDLVP